MAARKIENVEQPNYNAEQGELKLMNKGRIHRMGHTNSARHGYEAYSYDFTIC